MAVHLRHMPGIFFSPFSFHLLFESQTERKPAPEKNENKNKNSSARLYSLLFGKASERYLWVNPDRYYCWCYHLDPAILSRRTIYTRGVETPKKTASLRARAIKDDPCDHDFAIRRTRSLAAGPTAHAITSSFLAFATCSYSS